MACKIFQSKNLFSMLIYLLLHGFLFRFLQKYEKYISENNFNLMDNKTKDAMIKKK